MDKAGRSGAGWRSVGGRSAVGERRSEVGRRLVGGRSEVGRRSVGRRSGAGRSVETSDRPPTDQPCLGYDHVYSTLQCRFSIY